VVDLFYSHGVDNRLVQFEITESAFMDKFVRAVQTLDCLRYAGFRIALDDFGTGYSSLQYLQHLPVDVIKIDRSFTKKVPGNPKAEAVLRTILDLGRRLNLEIIAEGVEIEQQFRYLKRQGSRHFQGFYFYKPMGINELLALLQQTKGESLDGPYPQQEEE
jgi:EAL domain-containing protein (putative c-di-GMP-specific phosphodiesterase class I)